MYKLTEVLTKLLTIALAGAIGAGVVVLAVSETDLIGSASGKRAKKKKRPPTENVWRDVAQELNAGGKPVPPPAANPPANTPPIAAPQLIADLDSVVPSDPLLDPPDPALCARNQIVQNGRNNLVRTFMKGEVRGFSIDTGHTNVFCEVTIFPKGCDRVYYFDVRAQNITEDESSARARATCAQLGTALFHKRPVFIQADQYLRGHKRYDNEKHEIQRLSLTPQTMDEFAMWAQRGADNEDTIRAIQSLPSGAGLGDAIGRAVGN